MILEFSVFFSLNLNHFSFNIAHLIFLPCVEENGYLQCWKMTLRSGRKTTLSLETAFSTVAHTCVYVCMQIYVNIYNLHDTQTHQHLHRGKAAFFKDGFCQVQGCSPSGRDRIQDMAHA